VGDSENSPETITFRTGYAASRISCILNGRTNKFGWLQAPATNGVAGLDRLVTPSVFVVYEQSNSRAFLLVNHSLLTFEPSF
jgi:hypothetical protein